MGFIHVKNKSVLPFSNLSINSCHQTTVVYWQFMKSSITYQSLLSSFNSIRINSWCCREKFNNLLWTFLLSVLHSVSKSLDCSVNYFIISPHPQSFYLAIPNHLESQFLNNSFQLSFFLCPNVTCVLRWLIMLQKGIK